MSLDSLLNHSITVQYPVPGKDTSGGSTRAYTNLSGASNVPATIQQLTNRERAQVWAQRQVFQTHRIYISDDLAIKKEYLIIDDHGTKYIVQGYTNQAGRDYFYSIDVREQT